MNEMSDANLKRIFNAALTLFNRNGYRRTSMADIAREAEIARATLYLRFSDKGSVFEAIATSLIDEALARAESAWIADAPLSKNIAATLLAKELGFFKMLNNTPHGAELLEINVERTAAHVSRLDTEFAKLLGRRGRDALAMGADLSAFGGVDGFAMFLATAGAGIKHEARTEGAFRSAIEQLAQVAAYAASQK